MNVLLIVLVLLITSLPIISSDRCGECRLEGHRRCIFEHAIQFRDCERKRHDNARKYRACFSQLDARRRQLEESRNTIDILVKKTQDLQRELNDVKSRLSKRNAS